MAGHHAELRERHPSVGWMRHLGLFGIVELIRDRTTMEPMAAFNTTSDEMKAIAQRLDERGLFTMVRWNAIMTNPPLVISRSSSPRASGSSTTRWRSPTAWVR
jgi:taurine---2-oxoglutarate transaminase